MNRHQSRGTPGGERGTCVAEDPGGSTVRRRAGIARVAVPALLLLALLLSACSQHRELYPRLESLAAAGEYEQAVNLIENNKDEYGDRNEVLYNLDRGVMLHFAGRYKESNTAFEAAEVRMDELWQESISGNVAAFLSNDNTLPYGGEDFEQVLVNVYRALNYAKLGDLDGALVEARKVNEKLNYINGQYEEDEKNEYREDAFARALAGIFYQIGGTRNDLNDAFISYRNAAGIYEKDFQPLYGTDTPTVVRANLLSTASFMGSQEFQEALARFPDTQSISLNGQSRLGQLLFVHFAGRGPEKVEDNIVAVMPDANVIRIAFPRYRRRSYLITGSRIRVDGVVEARLEEGQPVGAIAVKNLDNRKGRIAAKAIARATTKYIASKAAQNAAREQSEGLGLLAWIAGNVYTIASEQADLRSWQTLPDKILIGRVLLPPGKHRVQVEYTTGGSGVVSTQDLGEIELRAGQSRIFTLHSLDHAAIPAPSPEAGEEESEGGSKSTATGGKKG
jgi:hypothetical protein